MTRPGDEEIATTLRAEVDALPSGGGSLDDVVTAGRRRVRTRRAAAGLGTLTVVAVLGVASLQVAPGQDRGLPADRPTVTLTDEPERAPDPQPVYDALDARLAAMGLPAEHSGWATGPVVDGVALIVNGPGFQLETARLDGSRDTANDPLPVPADGLAGSCAVYRAEVDRTREEQGEHAFLFDCEDVDVPDGQLAVLSSEGLAVVAVLRDGDVQVSVRATSGNQVPGEPLGRDDLVEIATDPDLRWR